MRLLPGGRLDGLDRARAQREFVVGDDQAPIHPDHPAKAPASVARAHGGVEREGGGDGFAVAQVAVGAMQAGGEAPEFGLAFIHQPVHIQPPAAALERYFNRLHHARALGAAPAEAVGHHIQDFAFTLVPLGLHLGKAAGRKPLLHLFGTGVGRQLDRKREHDARVTGHRAARCQLGIDGVGRVVPHGLRSLLVKQLPRARKQQLEVIVQLRHRAHGGAAGAHGVGLVDSDGRRHALYTVHRWLVHSVQKLARVGAEGLHIATLALGVQRVKHQAGFARAAGAGHHRQLAGADVQVQVAKVVLACATDANGSLGHGGSLSGIRPNILGSAC